MRNGFTTGSCAAAAAKAAAFMAFSQKKKDTVTIMTPAGIIYETKLEDVMTGEDDDGIKWAKCAVRKDSGDDPDVTAGMLVYAGVRLVPQKEDCVMITGGEGIGKVTKPGLDRPVGDHAINTVPRRMIEQEVREVMEEHEFSGTVCVEISAPGGEEIAKKTFNPRLGIEGGISIIGTSGIVEPMSTRAIIDTIRVELKQKKEMGSAVAVVSPGNYGLDFMREHYGYDLEKATKCSNFIGDTIDIARELGFEDMLLVGHVGKLIKLSGGIMNTHSREADCRMELMAAAAARAGAPADVLDRILDCVSTEEAYAVMCDAHIEKKSFEHIMERIGFYLKKRAGDMGIGCIVYSNSYGLLGKTENAERLLET